ncbi:hypothetical protein ACJ73_05710 [Blastomyces percursus]|uniref:non-specific serine/threonine protein kinase n=1 Tax=Blastomyces percursus TaxID=1658174 RepID=A0A1J9Q4C1_9EURO|nr:hypothetical protein ACJ73_05710 [Blastomyces percursus]
MGDRYQNDRYEVVHKLGFGSYSTVWLAKDLDKGFFVALKIVVATVLEKSRETKILTIHFEKGFTSQQHSLLPRHLRSISDVYHQLGEPMRLPVQRLDGKSTGSETPRYCVPVARTYISCQDVEKDCEVVIADFRETFLSAASKRLHTPVLLLPPEFLFDEPLGTASDPWTLGSTLYNILGENALFEGFMPDEDHAIAEMIGTLGHFPEKWRDRWQKKGDFFLSDGSCKKDIHLAPRSMVATSD